MQRFYINAINEEDAGGGVALVRALKAIEKLTGANEDQTTGIKILARAIEEPLKKRAFTSSWTPRTCKRFTRR